MPCQYYERVESFKILNHQEIHDHQKLPELWREFSVLVHSLLLPMAEEGVIHHDIRSSKECTYNAMKMTILSCVWLTLKVSFCMNHLFVIL
jgi:hypothetical protein